MHNLKKLRESRGLYQKDVAAAIGVDRTTYVKYERGDSEPSFQILDKLAQFFNVSVDYILGRDVSPNLSAPRKVIKIPVLGQVQAGIPLDAVQDILDYEEITSEMAASGEHFALQVRGDSMEPRIKEGDVVIVRKQSDVESGDTAVVLVNGDAATVKRIKKSLEGIMLIPNNPAYEPLFYSNQDIQNLPVTILGKVVELRGKF